MSLGRKVWWDAVEAGLVASLSSFAGATLPLLIAGVLPGAPWIGLVVGLILLGPRWLAVSRAAAGAGYPGSSWLGSWWPLSGRS